MRQPITDIVTRWSLSKLAISLTFGGEGALTWEALLPVRPGKKGSIITLESNWGTHRCSVNDNDISNGSHCPRSRLNPTRRVKSSRKMRRKYWTPIKEFQIRLSRSRITLKRVVPSLRTSVITGVTPRCSLTETKWVRLKLFPLERSPGGMARMSVRTKMTMEDQRWANEWSRIDAAYTKVPDNDADPYGVENILSRKSSKARPDVVWRYYPYRHVQCEKHGKHQHIWAYRRLLKMRRDQHPFRP